MKKTKIALALGGLIFLAAPLSSVFATEKHHEMQEMQMGDSMQYIKNELRGYVDGVKSNDTQKMQQHLNELLKLSELPAMDHSNMDHSEMNMNSGEHDMSAMPSMEGMSPAQHQHMMYMQGIAGLNDLFKQLAKTQDKTEIKLILGKIKEHIKNNRQLFS